MCKAFGEQPTCQCISGYIGTPPNCRPECVINGDCPAQLACINNKCQNPCIDSCGTGAECHVISHTVSCVCPPSYTGNPFVQCVPHEKEILNPCEPSPCAANAECIHRNGVGACRCIQDYFGNPYEGCRPECVLQSDCPPDKACIRNKCENPCKGVCGLDAECLPVNHVPTCICPAGYTGDPFSACERVRDEPVPPVPIDVCRPSPCGLYSKCHEVNGIAVCSCEENYIGSPPNCRPECTVNSECPHNKACHKFKCKNPCDGTCGVNAECQVINHNPICSCPPNLVGDPFVKCTQPPQPPEREVPQNPCNPSPCGNFAECRPVGDRPTCSCLANYIGSPPNCRPECVVNTDCPSDKSCIAERCRNPCEGSCGFNSECRIQNHIPICTCLPRFTGDPFTQCFEIIEKPEEKPRPYNPCDPSPCGSNALCDNAICTCVKDYFGDPYIGCRPECTMNTECSPTKACLNNHCVDPCANICGSQATCVVSNHIPSCACPQGYTGDPFVACRPTPVITVPQELCNPSPCKCILHKFKCKLMFRFSTELKQITFF